MPGYAVFIPDDTENANVFCAQKRPTPQNEHLNNNPDIEGGVLLNANNLSHTERQLIHRILDGVTPETHGTVFIYTRDSPCTNRDEFNGNFSCVEYYRTLTANFPNINFHVYFHTVGINPNFITSNVAARDNLIAVITALVQTEAALNDRFRIHGPDNDLQYNAAGNGAAAQWINATVNLNQFTNKVNNLLTGDIITNNQKTQIFEQVFHVNGVAYHVI